MISKFSFCFLSLLVLLAEFHDELAEDEKDAEEEEDSDHHQSPAEGREAWRLCVLLPVPVRGPRVEAPPLPRQPELLAPFPALEGQS